MSKFKKIDHYEKPLEEGYKLLPFKFTELRNDSFVLSNLVGEHLVLPKQTLTALVEHKLGHSSEAYKDLKAKHFITDSDSNSAIDLLTVKLRTKLQRLSEFTALHIFVVTLRCEHSCPYCQVSRKNDESTEFDMSVETAEKALTAVFRSPSRSIKIEFQGGESLLNFPLIKHIVLRAAEINKTQHRDLQFVIATNLALISREVLEFCREYGIYLSTSLDGPKELHNKNRPRPGGNSYEKTIEGIKLAREFLGRDRVSALMTTTSASLTQVKAIIDEYIEQEIDGIFLRPLSPYGFAIKTKYYRAYDADEWLKFYFEGLDYIIELNKSGFFFVEHYAALILRKILSPFSVGYVDLMSPAGIGIAAVVYNYDGDVYASDEGRMLAEMKDKTFRIGNLHTNSYEEIFTCDKLLNPLEESFSQSAPMCNDCAFEPYCGAEPVYHYATQKDYVGHKPSSGFCNRNMSIFKKLISLMEDNAETREVFYRWAGV